MRSTPCFRFRISVYWALPSLALSCTAMAAPRAPADIVIHEGDRSITLNWSAIENASGYYIYRAPNASGPFERITTAPVSQNGFVDFSVTNGAQTYYALTAVNSAREESPRSTVVKAVARAFANDAEFLDFLQRCTFDFFWFGADPRTGMVPDRTRPGSFISIAGVGFQLTALCIGVERSWITREQARDRVLKILRVFRDGPQGINPSGMIGCHGWFYHFLTTDSLVRFRQCELSSIDTALLLAGILDAQTFFGQTHPVEAEIRSAADTIVQRVDWRWMTNRSNTLSMGWHPETGFLASRWVGYNEAMILYLLALGASREPLPPTAWTAWTAGYLWRTNYSQAHVEFPPLFGHQYSHCWVDFRGITDRYLASRGLDYFENSRRATLAQRAYCAANPGHFTGYGSMVWGLTACDGPGRGRFAGYSARGAPPAENDDGTIAPTAVGGSVPFAPEICVPTLRHFYDQYRTNIWTCYGFRDAFNLTAGWWDPEVIAIDQGPIVLMIENYRTESVWRRFRDIPQIRRGLSAAGFQKRP